MIRLARALAALLLAAPLLAAPAPALAQFAAQQTYAASSGGAANDFVVTIPNVNQASDLVGVPIRVLMSASSSSASKLAVSNGSMTVIPATAIEKLTTSGLTPLVSGEVAAGQISTFVYDGSVFELVSPTISLATTQSQNGFVAPTNLQINATVNSNQLTIAVKAANVGADPSAANPVLAPFRDTTIANGIPLWRTISGPLGFTIASGSTMGCQSATMCRLWLFLADNSGTTVLCAYNAKDSSSSVLPIDEASLQTSGAGTSGGSSSQTLYCSTAIVNKAVRYAGYVDIQESSAGTWSTGPTVVQLFGPGVKKPGDVLQSRYVTSFSSDFNNSTTTFKAVSPSATVTPSSAANAFVVKIEGDMMNDTAGGDGSQLVVMRTIGASTVTVGIVANVFPSTTNTNGHALAVQAVDSPNTTNPVVYQAGIRSIGGGTSTFPNSTWGGFILVQEIQG